MTLLVSMVPLTQLAKYLEIMLKKPLNTQNLGLESYLGNYGVNYKKYTENWLV